MRREVCHFLQILAMILWSDNVILWGMVLYDQILSLCMQEEFVVRQRR